MKAPAKINLYLNITGKRIDGYHLLDTLIAFTDIYDEVAITPSSSFSLEVTGPFAGLVEHDERNIVARATRMMSCECDHKGNVAIKLTKNIPVGAGLGGGSADCAVTLILLNEIFNAGFSKERLADIGVRLGADVPVFINHHAAFVSGIGEKIRNVENMPGLYAVLVYPDIHIATKDVYTRLSQQKSLPLPGPEHDIIITQPRTSVQWLNFLRNQRNDLEDTAISFAPEIKGLIAELSSMDACVYARMSGSGSTCFAVFTDKHIANERALMLKKKYPGFWVQSVDVCQETTHLPGEGAL